MTFMYVELFNYRDAWRNEGPEKRTAFLEWVSAQSSSLPDEKFEVVGFGMNDPETDKRAPYDFFCVFKFADQESLDMTFAAIAASDWYRYFDQVNLSGPIRQPAEMHLIWQTLGEPNQNQASGQSGKCS
ncbi:hypothetical protein JQ616_17500 [Bradyrhizobium tropiciagri]|uniref:DUF6616 family protein n=1 Tax=Bradyrhizobium tropiciagri TaxID=312253 RepID=UPI001BA56D51|nr:DUF6616 family protein [Bradyrhizobium tropiciagri]MBR0896762.1 hypothetical protein [Bradyrhizobium tropiciagri]